MKDSLFELLMNFFEKSLSQLEKSTATEKAQTSDQSDLDSCEGTTLKSRTLIMQSAKSTAMRVFTDDEKRKLTKASYQFLTRLLLWGILAPEVLELAINQLLISDSRFVTLQETKWTIRNTLGENLDASELAFLDLVLYQKEDKLALH